MESIVCDVCGEAAVVHSTSIDRGKKTESHMCAAHAAEVGLISDPARPSEVREVVTHFVDARATGLGGSLTNDAAWRGLVDTLGGTVNFIRRHGVSPSSEAELKEGMALEQGDFPMVDIDDGELREKVECMERLIGFCRTHKRMPTTPEEWAQFAPGS